MIFTSFYYLSSLQVITRNRSLSESNKKTNFQKQVEVSVDSDRESTDDELEMATFVSTDHYTPGEGKGEGERGGGGGRERGEKEREGGRKGACMRGIVICTYTQHLL